MRWMRCVLVLGAMALLSFPLSAGASTSADTVPPSAPRITLRSASATTLSFAWSGATDNVAVSGYEVRLGEGRLIPVALPRTEFKNLACNSRPLPYHYGTRRATLPSARLIASVRL